MTAKWGNVSYHSQGKTAGDQATLEIHLSTGLVTHFQNIVFQINRQYTMSNNNNKKVDDPSYFHSKWNGFWGTVKTIESVSIRQYNLYMYGYPLSCGKNLISVWKLISGGVLVG
jgi:hypothetical protein